MIQVMKTDKKKYTVENFHEQLSLLRIHRGFKTQSQICKHLNISKQVWSLWETGKRTPGVDQLSYIADALDIDINYFFTDGGAIEEYDKSVDSTRLKIEKYYSGDKENIFKIMPFTETYVAEQLFKILDYCRYKKGVYSISVFSDSGVTRSILEYLSRNPEGGRYIPEKDYSPDILKDSGNAGMVIVDNASRLSGKDINDLITRYSLEYLGSVLLVGPGMKGIIKEIGLYDQVEENLSVDCITAWDFEAIVKNALLNITVPQLNMIKMETDIQLAKLFDLLQTIYHERKSGNMADLNTLLGIVPAS